MSEETLYVHITNAPSASADVRRPVLSIGWHQLDGAIGAVVLIANDDGLLHSYDEGRVVACSGWRCPVGGCSEAGPDCSDCGKRQYPATVYRCADHATRCPACWATYRTAVTAAGRCPTCGSDATEHETAWGTRYLWCAACEEEWPLMPAVAEAVAS